MPYGNSWETWELGMQLQLAGGQLLTLVYLFVKGGIDDDPLSYWGRFYNETTTQLVDFNLALRQPPRSCHFTPTYNEPAEVFDDDLACELWASFLVNTANPFLLPPTGAHSKRQSKGSAISIRRANLDHRMAHRAVFGLGLVKVEGPVDGFTLSASMAHSLYLGYKFGVPGINPRTGRPCVWRPMLYSIICDSPMVSHAILLN